jgi:hypothetical protein
MPEVIGEYIDRLCTVEMRPLRGNLPRGVIHRLYAAARGDGPPLTLRAAQALLSSVQPGSTVLLLTGAGGPPVLPQGEVDGPLGAAALARVLRFACGANVVFLAEERVEAPLRAACEASGLRFLQSDDPDTESSVRFVPMPTDDEGSRGQAQELLAKGPAAVVAIEKLSPNSIGVTHSSTGLRYPDFHGNPQHLMDGARDRGILTIGIGDGGNEAGFGVIRATVREVMPAGAVCFCDCGGGTAAATEADLLIVAAISDWGAYGVAAMMCWLLGTPEALVTSNDVERMLIDVVRAGAYDGCHARPILADDGVPLETQRGFMQMLRAIIEIGRSELVAPGH